MSKRRPRVLEKRVVHENPHFQVWHDKLVWPEGTHGDYFHVVRPTDVSVVIPRDENGRLIFIEQYRYTQDAETIEFPAGALDREEKPEDAARRELREETGYSAADVTWIGGFDLMATPCHVFLATGLTLSGEPCLEPSEFDMTVHRFSPDDVRRSIAQGRITDEVTLAAWAIAAALGLI